MTDQNQQPAQQKKSSFTAVILFAVVAIVALIAVIVVFVLPIEISELNLEKPHAAKSRGIQEPASISDWQTYKNEELGFEFEYPKNWEAIHLSDFKSGVVLKSPNYSSITSGEVVFSGEIYINAIPNPRNLSLIDLIRSFDDTSGFWPDKFNYTTFSVNGNEVVRFDSVQESNSFSQETIFVKFDQRVVSISYIFDQEKDTEVSKTLDKIISTFKFID